jgi:4-diphosphocytidyl-2-C-methyl-D-erythritol kinase
VPPVQVSTAAIFADPELTRDSPPITIRAFREGAGRNDLEPVARRLYPEVGEALDWLRQYGPACMTGSGACVFLQVADRAEAERILAQRPRGCDSFTARGVNRSPLLAYSAVQGS